MNQSTDAAWEKLQKQLAKEAVNSQWTRWSKQLNEHNGALKQEEVPLLYDKIADSIPHTGATSALEAIEPVSGARKSLFRSWLKRNRNWMSGASVASVLTIILLTPVGNHALAAILNQFHMQQVTVVQEDDLRQMMNNVLSDGKTRESINKFGAFTHTSGTLNGQYTIKEAEQLLQYKLIAPKVFNAEQDKVYLSPSNEITLKLNVDEVNQALQRLGAKKMLPQAIDGKPIKLIFGESASFSMNSKQNINGYYLTEQPVPVIDVDPSIPVAEALDAVIQFPLLPQYLKDSLKQSGVLDGGNIPLPVIANKLTEKHTIQGVDVILSTQSLNEEKTNNAYYSATWVKKGQLYTLNGHFTDKNAVLALTEELISQ